MNKKQIVKEYLYVTLGCLIMALSVVWFLDPYKIVPGGLTGLGIVLYESFKIPLGTTILIFNIPLLITGSILLGKDFGIKSIYGIVLTSVFIDLIKEVIYPYFLPSVPLYVLLDPASIDYMNSVVPLLASIFGGLTLGIGLGIVLLNRGSTGGSDVIAQIAVNYHIMKAGHAFMIIDSIVIISAGIVFGMQKNSFPYGITAMLLGLSSLIAGVLVIDFIIEGGKNKKGVTIITKNPDAMLKLVLDKMGKGATIYYGEGAYSGEKRKIIFTVVSSRHIYKIKRAIQEFDPEAFVVVNHVVQVFGEGFEKIKA